MEKKGEGREDVGGGDGEEEGNRCRWRGRT